MDIIFSLPEIHYKKTVDGNYKEVGRMAGLAASEWSWGHYFLMQITMECVM